MLQNILGGAALRHDSYRIIIMVYADRRSHCSWKLIYSPVWRFQKVDNQPKNRA
jgi:hypothetical protein